MVPENNMEVTKEGKKLRVYPTVSPMNHDNDQQWQDIPKIAISGIHIPVATKSCLIELESHSIGDKQYLILET